MPATCGLPDCGKRGQLKGEVQEDGKTILVYYCTIDHMQEAGATRVMGENRCSDCGKSWITDKGLDNHFCRAGPSLEMVLAKESAGLFAGVAKTAGEQIGPLMVQTVEKLVASRNNSKTGHAHRSRQGARLPVSMKSPRRGQQALRKSKKSPPQKARLESVIISKKNITLKTARREVFEPALSATTAADLCPLSSSCLPSSCQERVHESLCA